MKKTKVICSALAAAALLSCGPSDLRRSIEDMVVTNATMYVAGYYSNPGFPEKYPCYWVNGVKTDLQVPASTLEGKGYAITKGGPDIYAAGYTMDASANRIACYWKNASRTELAPSPSEAKALYVWDNVLYVGGVHYDGTYNAPTCWTNDPATPALSLGSIEGYVKAVFVNGNGVYLAGAVKRSTDLNPCYWEDGQRTDLVGVEASSIYVADNMIYTAGTQRTPSVPCYWEDESMTTLSSALPGCATSTVYHDDLYIGGYLSNGTVFIPCYWVDGVRTDLEGIDGWHAYVNSIVVYGGCVFAAGSCATAGGSYPCVWRDGERIDLPGGYGEAYAIYVE